MKIRNARAASWAALVMLAGCGSGDDGSPTPVATTPEPTATTFAAGGAGPLVGSIRFDTNDNGIVDADEPVAYTDRGGLAGRTVTGLAASGGTLPATATTRMIAVGADSATGFIAASLSAPKGATVISPITTIIDKVGDQSLVRRATGLSLAGTAIRDATDLLAFPAAQRLGNADVAVAADAARITAVNLRLLALMQLVSRFQGDPVDVGSGTGPEGAEWIAAVIRETGSADFKNPDFVQRVLAKGGVYIPYRPEQTALAADIFARFMRTMPDTITDAPTAYRYTIAWRFFALAAIKRVFAAYPSAEADRVRLLTNADLEAAPSRFADTPRPVVDGQPYALPDYREIRGTTTISAISLLANDTGRFPYGVSPGGKTLTGVSIDPRFVSQVTLSQSTQGDITVTPADGFSGLVWFNYSARAEGVETNQRVYVAIRP